MSLVPISSHLPVGANPQTTVGLITKHAAPEVTLGYREPLMISEVGMGLALILGILGVRFFGFLLLKHYRIRRMVTLLQRMAQLERLLSDAPYSKRSIRP